MGKVRVLRIIARLNVGGPAKHVAILTEGLDKNRFDSTLLYGSIENGEGDMSYLAGSGMKTVYIPYLSRSINPIGDLKAIFKIYSIIRKERPCIVHTHTAKAGTLGRIAAIAAGVPIKVHTFHGHIFYGYFIRPLAKLFLVIERILAHFTDRIIAISDMQKDELLNKYRIGREDRYSVVNIGLDLDRFLNIDQKKGLLKKRYGFTDGDILVGIIGRLVPVKNHRMFIRAAGEVKNCIGHDLFSRVKFIIIGNGPEKEALADYARSQGLIEKMVFTGWIKDIEEAYADLDIVTLTSKNEGTPLSLIEALASSKPVIATDVGGVRDVIGDIGILVGPDDEKTFAKELSGLIKSEMKLRQMGLKARDAVMNKFSRGNLICRMEELYKELLLKKGISV